MDEQEKAAQAKRRAKIYDVIVVMLAFALVVQVIVPAVIPLVHALKGTDAPTVATKVTPK